MKFLLQVRFNGADKTIAELPEGEQQQLSAEFETIRQDSGVLDASQLQPAATAATVRVVDGQTHATDGAAVEAENALNGYYLYDAPDVDAAIAFAARIPVARLGGTVEVRPLLKR
jgi:hypothetical protein